MQTVSGVNKIDEGLPTKRQQQMQGGNLYLWRMKYGAGMIS